MPFKYADVTSGTFSVWLLFSNCSVDLCFCRFAFFPLQCAMNLLQCMKTMTCQLEFHFGNVDELTGRQIKCNGGWCWCDHKGLVFSGTPRYAQVTPTDCPPTNVLRHNSRNQQSFVFPFGAKTGVFHLLEL